MKEEFEKSFAILSSYESCLGSLGVRPAWDTDDPTGLGHCMWMCQECMSKIEYNQSPSDLAKVSRWIGWIQCALVSAGIFSLDECRAHSSNSKMILDEDVNSCDI